MSTDRAGPRPRIICWGEVLWDLFPDGRRLGGAPANVAYHLAALGADVALVTRVGDDDLGREALAILGDAGVDLSLAQVDAERATGTVDVEMAAGEARYTMVPGRAWERIAATAKVLAALAAADAFTFGTLTQIDPIGRDALQSALAAVPPTCLRVLDVNLRPRAIDDDVLAASIAAADLVKLNDAEAARVEERLGRTTRDLLAAGVATVAVTRGARGSEIVRARERGAHPGFPAGSGGDNVGCGDAYLAALTLLVLAGAPLPAAAEAANRYAAHIAGERGATPAIDPSWIAELTSDALQSAP